MSVVKGHGLINEGTGYQPGHPSGTYLRRYWALPHDMHGVAVCRCGALSEPLPSNAARKRWHEDHKESVRRLRVLSAPPKEAKG